jgi:hypothetical protein
MNSPTRKNRVAGLIAGFSLHIRLGNAFDLSCMALPLEHSRTIVNGTKDPVGTALPAMTAGLRPALLFQESLELESDIESRRFSAGEPIRDELGR